MSLKKDFPLFDNNPGLVYLDSAATLQKPAYVIDGVKTYLENDYANIHRGWYSLSEKSELLYWQARKKVAHFLGGKDDEVIFTASATDSVNKLVKSLIVTGVIGKGDKVLLSELEHHANIIPWQIAAKQHGFMLDFVGLDSEQQIDYADLAEKLDDTVKVVSLTMVSNVTGGVTDVRRVREILDAQIPPSPPFSRGESALLPRPLLILDASQAVPHFKVEVSELGADFLFFTGHKMGTLTGVGVLWGKQEHLNILEPAFGGGGMVEEVTKEGFSVQGSPDKFEAGTPNLVGVVSLKLAIEYMEQIGMDPHPNPPPREGIRLGYKSLYDLEEPLIAYCLEQFQQLEKEGIILLGPKDPTKRIGVFSFLLPPGKNATQLGQYMAEQDICIRCGAQCAHIFHAGLDDRTGGKACIQQTCRISLRGYNDIGDVKQFFDKLKLFLVS